MRNFGRIVAECIDITKNTKGLCIFEYNGLTNEVIIKIYPDGYNSNREENKCIYFPFETKEKYHASCLDYYTPQGIEFLINEMLGWLYKMEKQLKGIKNESN